MRKTGYSGLTRKKQYLANTEAMQLVCLKDFQRRAVKLFTRGISKWLLVERWSCAGKTGLLGADSRAMV